MNQILSVEQAKPKKKRNSGNGDGPMEIKKVVMIFAIIMILFGLTIIGSASYSMYKSAQVPAAVTQPVIEVSQITESQVQIKVTHDKELSTITFSWNNQNPVSIDVKGKSEITQILDIPSSGDSVLKVYAEDVREQSSTKTSNFAIQKAIEVELVPDNTQLNIIIESQSELAYMTYRWDEEDEQQIELESVYEAEQTIEIPRGEHTLTIVVVDIENNTEIVEQNIKGVTKPTLEVTKEENNLVIKASDEEGIKRVEFTVDGVTYGLDYDKVLPLEERKDIEYTYALPSAQSSVTVKVYNESGVTEEANV